MQILLVHPQSVVRETLRLQLIDTLNDEHLRIDPVSTEVEALRRIKEQRSDPYAALITSLDLPHDNTSASDQVRRGFRLVEALSAAGSKRTKCLIMSPSGTRMGSSLQIEGMYCLFFEDGPGMFEGMVSATRDALAGRKRQPRLSVKFLQDPNNRNWQCSLDGGQELPAFNNMSVDFELPSCEMRKLVQRSAGLATMREEWLYELANIGKQLQELIFQNHRLDNLLQVAVGTAGGIEKVRFAFNVNQDMFSLAVEALVGPEPQVLGFSPSRPKSKSRKLARRKKGRPRHSASKSQPHEKEDVELASFWMLKAPIYRSLSVTPAPISLGHTRSPLFEDGRKPINCLIIESDVVGTVEVPGKSEPVFLPELGNVDTECNALELHLRDPRHQDEWGINHVKRINLDTVPASQSFSRHLEDTLAEREWHLVHYSGHSLYVPAKKGSSGRGFLFLPGTNGTIEILNAGLFANWLTNAEFLFLSSCHSSEESFAFEMARNLVPAVVGFRWDIRDDLAADFASKFYDSLFRFRSIESAFVAARNGVRRDHGAKEQVWAAPMLVLVDSGRVRTPAA